MKESRPNTPAGPRKGRLICPGCGHTSDAVDGDWIVIDPHAPGRRFRCPRCGERFGDQPALHAVA